MTPKDLDALESLSDRLKHTSPFRPYIKKDLAAFPEVLEKLSNIEDAIGSALALIKRLRSEAPEHGNEHTVLKECEVERLLHLNRQLKTIARHLHNTALDVTPHLESKLANTNDPMCDYEIEVRIDFVLREDDPAYDPESDNYLTTRDVSLKIKLSEDPYWIDEDITFECPDELQKEPHCWFFHSLYYHHHDDPAQPALTFMDCLRIGMIFIDVQVWQQYSFDLDKNEWVNTWSHQQGTDFLRP